MVKFSPAVWRRKTARAMCAWPHRYVYADLLQTDTCLNWLQAPVDNGSESPRPRVARRLAQSPVHIAANVSQEPPIGMTRKAANHSSLLSSQPYSKKIAHSLLNERTRETLHNRAVCGLQYESPR